MGDTKGNINKLSFGNSDLSLPGPDLRTVHSTIVSQQANQVDSAGRRRTAGGRQQGMSSYQFGAEGTMASSAVNSVIPDCHEFILRKIEVWKMPTTSEV